MQSIIMNGEHYRNNLRDGFHALGLHECLKCFIDIDEDWEHQCRAYPYKNGYICERCYNKNTVQLKNGSTITRIDSVDNVRGKRAELKPFDELTRLYRE